MTYIGVDLGYKEPTTIVIVRTSDLNRRFTFSTIAEGTEFQEIVDRVAEMIHRLNIPPENLSAPGQPAFEKEVLNRFGKDRR